MDPISEISVPEKGNVFRGISRFTLDFPKVVRLVFWSGVVGPGTNDFYPLQRTKFTGGIFLLVMLSNQKQSYQTARQSNRSRAQDLET